VQNPSNNGYSGGFGYNLANGVTIAVEATKSETATTDASAFDILREVVKYVTPHRRSTFERLSGGTDANRLSAGLLPWTD
jgi:hypothetical protein